MKIVSKKLSSIKYISDKINSAKMDEKLLEKTNLKIENSTASRYFTKKKKHRANSKYDKELTFDELEDKIFDGVFESLKEKRKDMKPGENYRKSLEMDVTCFEHEEMICFENKNVTDAKKDTTLSSKLGNKSHDEFQNSPSILKKSIKNLDDVCKSIETRSHFNNSQHNDIRSKHDEYPQSKVKCIDETADSQSVINSVKSKLSRKKKPQLKNLKEKLKSFTIVHKKNIESSTSNHKQMKNSENLSLHRENKLKSLRKPQLNKLKDNLLSDSNEILLKNSSNSISIKEHKGKHNKKLSESLKKGRNTVSKNDKGKKLESSTSKSKEKTKVKLKVEAFSGSDMSDWEEVDEFNEIFGESSQSNTNEECVKIQLKASNNLWGIKKRKKKTQQDYIEEFVRRDVNRSVKENYENMHKTHLLCLFARGLYINSLLNSEELLASGLSLVTKRAIYPPKRLDISHLELVMKWFFQKISLNITKLDDNYWKTPLDKILRLCFEERKACSQQEYVFMFVVILRALGITVRLVLNLVPCSWKPPASILIRPKKEDEEIGFDEKKADDLSKDDMKLSDRLKMSKSIDVTTTKTRLDIGESSTQKTKKRKSDSSGVSIDGDFDPASYSQKYRSKVSNLKGKKRKSSETYPGESKKKKGGPLLEWVEVYFEEEEKWICVDVLRRKVHCAKEIEGLTNSLAYVVAYNQDLTIKDVTRRYVSSWLSSEHKIRCDSEWWSESVHLFCGDETPRDRAEDEEISSHLQTMPLPKAFSEYKNHKLYALQRHLLKFEAIYPPNVKPEGFFKGEPVYKRECIVTLKGRENWMKEAMTVKVDEKPYKVVKARPKWDKSVGAMVRESELEVFGFWQVEDYDPPAAKNGKVPRNQYGNLDVYKPSMVPKGCVHLNLKGLSRIANKLGIDCVPAMVGFDFSRNGNHPIFDGFIVCTEYEDVLKDAWNEDQKEQLRRKEERRVKRIYNNWKKLIKGLIIKESMREKYADAISKDESDLQEKYEFLKKEVELKRIEEEKCQKLSKERGDVDIRREELSAIFTHRIPNLKIDFDCSVVDQARKERRKGVRKIGISNIVNKHRLPPKKRSSRNLEIDCNQSVEDEFESRIGDSLMSSDEEKLTEGEKKENIKKILSFNSENIIGKMAPDLSDESSDDAKDAGDDGKMYMEKEKIGSSSQVNYEKLVPTKRSKGKTRINPKKLSSDNSSDESSDCESFDFDKLNVASKNKRRSVRNAKPSTHKEDESSNSDISIKH